MGAQALESGGGDRILEPGKRADLIVVDLDQTHNAPRFGRDPGAVYSQLVYAAKATDVVDAMCDGRWLMRDRQLLTIDEAGARAEAAAIARRIDTFLIEREGSVLQKLVAIGGAAEQESFEVQVKVKLTTPDDVLKALLASDEITMIRSAHYHQYDTYFFFDDPAQGAGCVTEKTKRWMLTTMSSAAGRASP
jgi:5-methylthioadenosine/S-adenosylhomocysteine deaminase